jgi:hypothetical protein
MTLRDILLYRGLAATPCIEDGLTLAGKRPLEKRPGLIKVLQGSYLVLTH